MVREGNAGDLPQLLKLYLHLHEKALPDPSAALAAWSKISADEGHHVIVYELNGEIVSSCVCVIVPNLTRNARPYALIENVVTRRDCRGRGYASECLAQARSLAQAAGCYKMMLLTGAKEEATLRFYRNAGFNSADKTAFIQWLDES